MGRKPKELDYDTIRTIITDTRTPDRKRLPTAQEITRKYNDRENDNVHHKTIKNFLERDERFTAVRVGDYTGWSTPVGVEE